MPYAFVQQADGVVTGSGTTVATGTGGTNFGAGLTAGNLKAFVCFYTAATSKTITFSDVAGNNNAAHVQVGGGFFNATDLQGAVWGYVRNITGGTGTTTATANAAVTFFCIYCVEYSGLDTVNPFIDTNSNRQVTVVTTVNALRAGQMKASIAPTMQFSISNDFTAAAGIPNAGGGFTSRTGVWNFGALSTRPEDMRRIDSAEVFGNLTPTSTTDTYYTIGMLFAETGASGVGLGGIAEDDRWRARPPVFLGNGTGSSGIIRSAWPDDTQDQFQRDNVADNRSRAL